MCEAAPTGTAARMDNDTGRSVAQAGGLSDEELDEQHAAALPDREAMSTIGLDLTGIDNFAMPIDEAIAINNQSVNSAAAARPLSEIQRSGPSRSSTPGCRRMISWADGASCTTSSFEGTPSSTSSAGGLSTLGRLGAGGTPGRGGVSADSLISVISE